jgi:hypothetical protein
MSINIDTKTYKVVVTGYAERHFIKGFQKKYPGSSWTKTLETICFMLERADGLRETDKAEIIHSCDGRHIIKGNFAVIGTRESPKSSGNRYVAFVDDTTGICEILLVYGKNDVV